MKKILLGDELLIIFAQIDGIAFGIDIQSVVSVLEPLKARKVPAAPKYINSIVNHHGNIVTLLDLKAYFKPNALPELADKKVVYLKHKEIQLGLVVDRISRIDYLSPSYLERIPEGGGGDIRSEFCQGVFVLDEEEICFLDTKKVLDFAGNLEIHF